MSIPYPFGFHSRIGLGIRQYSPRGSGIQDRIPSHMRLIAGGINGSILASIVLATLGEKLQAGTTGLLGGYGLHDAASKFKLTQQYIVGFTNSWTADWGHCSRPMKVTMWPSNMNSFGWPVRPHS